MSPRKTPYENLKAKAARGEYTLVDPLDYRILGCLDEEGAMFMGIYPQGKTTEQIAKEEFEGALTSSQISPRMSLLREQGLVASTRGVGTSGRPIWQRTTQGKLIWQTWKTTKESGDGS